MKSATDWFVDEEHQQRRAKASIKRARWVRYTIRLFPTERRANVLRSATPLLVFFTNKRTHVKSCIKQQLLVLITHLYRQADIAGLLVKNTNKGGQGERQARTLGPVYHTTISDGTSGKRATFRNAL
ncbi:MAG TPA: hypothetical protein VFZ52_11075, partial [Chryseolinea sp.]